MVPTFGAPGNSLITGYPDPLGSLVGVEEEGYAKISDGAMRTATT